MKIYIKTRDILMTTGVVLLFAFAGIMAILTHHPNPSDLELVNYKVYLSDAVGSGSAVALDSHTLVTAKHVVMDEILKKYINKPLGELLNEVEPKSKAAILIEIEEEIKKAKTAMPSVKFPLVEEIVVTDQLLDVIEMLIEFSPRAYDNVMVTVLNSSTNVEVKAKILRVHPKADVALLTIAIKDGFLPNSSKLANKIKMNERLSTVGYPWSNLLPVIITENTINIKTIYKNHDVMSTLHVEPGMSGGGVFNEEGELVGINKATAESPNLQNIFQQAQDASLRQTAGIPPKLSTSKKFKCIYVSIDAVRELLANEYE